MFRAVDYQQLKRLFFAFVLPSVGAQLLSGIYLITDGFFIGIGAGSAGLAAEGLAYPFTVFVTAIGAGIGVGGGALMSTSIGRGRNELAERILGTMVFMMVCASVLTCALFTFACGPLLALFGVSAEVGSLALVYARILLICSPFQVFTMGLLGAVRNDGFPRKAMVVMVEGFLINIFCGWLFVIEFRWGVAGGAWATVVAQLFTSVSFASHFLTGRSHVKLRLANLRPVKQICARIVSMGISPLGVQIAMAVSMLMHNWQALAWGGDLGVAAYAVVSYIVPIGVMLQEGIAEGMQPLMSFYYGANLSARRRITARFGFLTAVTIGVSCSYLLYVTAPYIPSFFSLTGEPSRVAARGLLLSLGMFPLMGLAKVGASCFQSVGRLRGAAILTYGDPLLLQPLFLWTLPLFFGLDGVWLAMTFTNIALAAIFGIMWHKAASLRLPSVGVFGEEEDEQGPEEASAKEVLVGYGDVKAIRGEGRCLQVRNLKELTKRSQPLS